MRQEWGKCKCLVGPRRAPRVGQRAPPHTCAPRVTQVAGVHTDRAPTCVLPLNLLSLAVLLFCLSIISGPVGKWGSRVLRKKNKNREKEHFEQIFSWRWNHYQRSTMWYMHIVGQQFSIRFSSIDRLYYYGLGTRFGASWPFDHAKSVAFCTFLRYFLGIAWLCTTVFFFSLLERHSRCLISDVLVQRWHWKKSRLERFYRVTPGVTSLLQSLRVSLDLTSVRATFMRNNLSCAGGKTPVWIVKLNPLRAIHTWIRRTRRIRLHKKGWFSICQVWQ